MPNTTRKTNRRKTPISFTRLRNLYAAQATAFSNYLTKRNKNKIYKNAKRITELPTMKNIEKAMQNYGMPITNKKNTRKH